MLRCVQGRGRSDKEVRNSAERNLRPIKNKLRGLTEEGIIISVPNHVEALIKQAMSPAHLVRRLSTGDADMFRD